MLLLHLHGKVFREMSVSFDSINTHRAQEGHVKRQRDDIKALKADVEEIIQKYQVEKYLSVDYERFL